MMMTMKMNQPQQEFVKVEGKMVEEIPAVPLIGLAYGFIWIAVLGYVLYVARGLARVRREIQSLRQRLERGSGGR